MESFKSHTFTSVAYKYKQVLPRSSGHLTNVHRHSNSQLCVLVLVSVSDDPFIPADECVCVQASHGDNELLPVSPALCSVRAGPAYFRRLFRIFTGSELLRSWPSNKQVMESCLAWPVCHRLSLI